MGRQEGEVVEETSETLIFPRYHQLDVVRDAPAPAATDGPGHSYLVQHSAGSGKSNSIAWTCHGLRQLYGADGERVFDTIIVVTDRKVLDKQLQDTVKQFEQTSGTVVAIDGTSRQLQQALEQGKDIVITTIQKFPVISKSIGDLGGTAFAVVIDEAHSSQSGESAKQLKETLSDAASASVSAPDGERDLEDLVELEVRLRGPQDHVSYFAFTATPKGKTLEIFGQRGADGQFRAHHLYSMRQAIEEGFILDVLKGYTTYKRYFKLVKAVEDDDEYETSRAVRALTVLRRPLGHRHRGESPHRARPLPEPDGPPPERAWARHVRDAEPAPRGPLLLAVQETDAGEGARLRSARGVLRHGQRPKDRGGAYRVVAQRSTVPAIDQGRVQDARLPPARRRQQVPDWLRRAASDDHLRRQGARRRPGGSNAQPAEPSRARQDETVVLDFVNEPDAILEAFQPYYQGAVLEEETDPNELYDLQRELADFEVYTPVDVDEFASLFFDPAVDGKQLQPPVRRALNQWRTRPEEEREDFRSALQSFVRLYAYVSQLVTFVDTDLEKTYVYARSLNKALDPRENAGLPRGHPRFGRPRLVPHPEDVRGRDRAHARTHAARRHPD